MRRSWRRLSPPSSLFSFHLLPLPLLPRSARKIRIFPARWPAGAGGSHRPRAAWGSLVALPFPSTQTGASVPRELTRPIAPRHVTTWPMRRMLLERAGPPDPVVDGRRGRRLESPHVDKRGQQHALRCLPPCLLRRLPPLPSSVLPAPRCVGWRTERVVVAARPAVPNSNQFGSVSMLRD